MNIVCGTTSGYIFIMANYNFHFFFLYDARCAFTIPNLLSSSSSLLSTTSSHLQLLAVQRDATALQTSLLLCSYCSSTKTPIRILLLHVYDQDRMVYKYVYANIVCGTSRLVSSRRPYANGY